MNDLDIMLEAFHWVTVQDIRTDGTVDECRVRNVAEFRAHEDGKIHRHRVLSPSGELLYERTPDGVVIVGAAGQKAKWDRKRRVAQKAGATGLQVLADSSRRAMRYWFGRH